MSILNSFFASERPFIARRIRSDLGGGEKGGEGGRKGEERGKGGKGEERVSGFWFLLFREGR